MDCNYCGYLKSVEPHRLIFEGAYWQVALSPDQQYLGKTFVTLRRHAEALSDITSAELNELGDVFKRFESSVNKAFKPTHFNWSCLMNDSVAASEPHHVHWHAIPRYKDERKVDDIKFIDQRWPKSARDMQPNMPGSDILAEITTKIKSGF